MLAVHARVLTTWPVHHTWQQLAGLPLEPVPQLALTPHEGEVPLLLRDPTALLIQFLLLLPLHIDQSMFIFSTYNVNQDVYVYNCLNSLKNFQRTSLL